jgi:hypothetical protein
MGGEVQVLPSATPTCHRSERLRFLPLGTNHKVHIYLEYHSECLLVGIGTPTPSTASEYTPPPGTKVGGGTLPAGEGVGESQFQRLEKKLSTLSTLCYK